MYIYMNIPHSSQLEAGIMCILCNTIYNDLYIKVMLCWEALRAGAHTDRPITAPLGDSYCHCSCRCCPLIGWCWTTQSPLSQSPRGAKYCWWQLASYSIIIVLFFIFSKRVLGGGYPPPQKKNNEKFHWGGGFPPPKKKKKEIIIWGWGGGFPPPNKSYFLSPTNEISVDVSISVTLTWD